MFCPACGHRLQDGDRFCGNCGHAVEDLRELMLADREPGPGAAESPSQGEAPEATDVRPPMTVRPPEATDTQPPASGEIPPRGDAPQAGGGKVLGMARPPLRTILAVAAAGAAVVVAIALGTGLGAGAPSGASTSTGDSAAEPEDASSSADATSVGAQGAGAEAAIARPTLVKPLSQSDEPVVKASLPATVASERLPQAVNYDKLSGVFSRAPGLKELLEKNGFGVVLTETGGKFNQEFFEVYERNRYNKDPNFVTTDAMMHTYHLYFSYLLRSTERGKLSEALSSLSHGLLDASQAQLKELGGTEWEGAAKRNVAYFSVACALLDPSFSMPAEAGDEAAREVELVEAASGVAKSPLFSTDEDYSQYAPRGYYAGEEGLERYFRTMMWYGRRTFLHSDEELDRGALLVTLALDGDLLKTWESVYAVTSFFAGTSDDLGCCEYRAAIESAYGEGVDVRGLVGNDSAWAAFRSAIDALRPPLINSLVKEEPDDGQDADKGFRLMGQRFSFDEAIFQALVYDSVGDTADGKRRTLPDALDVPAAMGSDAALGLLRDQGAFDHPGYEDTMTKLRTSVESLTNEMWSVSLYNRWLHTIDPLLDKKGEGYPSYMGTDAWARKDLVTYLGSYTELKHDTILYSKQVVAEGGADIVPTDDRGYVEAEPLVFERLGALTAATRDGLAGLGMLGDEESENLGLLQELAEKLGRIARDELAGKQLSDDDYELIRSFGVQLEHFWTEVYKHEADDGTPSTNDFPAPLVADVATDAAGGKCLELGTGKPATIYVLVEVDGSPCVASGSVFSFYQFEQPLSERLNDSTWRQAQGLEVDGAGQYGKPQHDVVPWCEDFAISLLKK